MTFQIGKAPWNKGTKGICKANSGSFGLGESHHNKPHSEETKRIISEKFKKRWEEGCYDKRPSHSKETREKIKNTLRKGKYITCVVCGKNKYVSPSKSNTKFCGHKCQGIFYSGDKNCNWNKGKFGEDNPIWKGGVSKNHPYKHYKNKEYITWRKQVFERDNYTCQKCGKRSGVNSGQVVIHPHHIKSYTKFIELRYKTDNGLTLCYECHKIIHGKKNR